MEIWIYKYISWDNDHLSLLDKLKAVAGRSRLDEYPFGVTSHQREEQSKSKNVFFIVIS
jgi:hypothetical protein